ncbi:hypothetical protein AAFC00_005805 [Neodothiora populina]|uniref:Uncharacterized protein n=1 Tax=Neodothiora populina TaxID=2781224 RepID=A0ABR3P771_9PEZI
MAAQSQLPQGEYVDPAQAQGAQIPLQSFSLPQFPPQAQGLKALTLTSDIKLDDYQSLLSQQFEIPLLPTSIESLTLELFSLGYPPGFLTQLADRLPNIKSLVVYSQLLGGVSEASQADCVEFFRKLSGLRALHLLDVFAKAGFFTSIAPYLTYSAEGEDARRGLMFLEINYTVQHSDADFLPKIQATELPKLIGPGLITAAFNVSEADVTDDPDDPNNASDAPEEELAKDGIMAFNKTLASGLVDMLTDEETRPRSLKVLNLTLYTLTPADLKKVAEKHTGLMVLSATIEVDEQDANRRFLVKTLASLNKLEQVEIVASPSLPFFMAVQNTRANALEGSMPSIKDMEGLAEKCKQLKNLKANILRSHAMDSLEWAKDKDKWEGGIKHGDMLISGAA